MKSSHSQIELIQKVNRILHLEMWFKVSSSSWTWNFSMLAHLTSKYVSTEKKRINRRRHEFYHLFSDDDEIVGCCAAVLYLTSFIVKSLWKNDREVSNWVGCEIIKSTIFFSRSLKNFQIFIYFFWRSRTLMTMKKKCYLLFVIIRKCFIDLP